jgi:hypothetical protein
MAFLSGREDVPFVVNHFDDVAGVGLPMLPSRIGTQK